MAAGALICTGDVTVAGDGAPLCSGYWSLVPVPEPFTVNDQVIADFAVAFGVGFSLGVLLPAIWQGHQNHPFF